MAIVVEGFDNSGKSTLAKLFGMEILHPGPRPKHPAEITRCLDEQAASSRLPVVMDRITAISNPMYDQRALHQCNMPYYWDYLSDMIATPGLVIIYCRPPLENIRDFSTHECKSYDDQEKLKWLQQHCDRIVKRYDGFMSSVPHMRYDYTVPNQDIVDAATSMQFVHSTWRKWRNALGI